MIFDKFCGIVERHIPILKETMENAKLFVFEGAAHTFLPKGPDAQPTEDEEELFALPFPITAIEDPASVIIFIDTEDNQTGLIDSKRHFIEIMPTVPDERGFREEENKKMDVFEEIPEELKSCVNIVLGTVKSMVPRGAQYTGDVSITGFAVAGKDNGLVIDAIGDKFTLFKQEELKEAGLNALTALEEIIYIYKKDRFVLESKPINKKKNKKKKILRSHERPIYTILSPKEIREKLNMSAPKQDSGRKSPIPHERRSHLRHYKAGGRYKEDKVVRIKAQWIGDSEKQIGKRFYKVRLDI